MMVWELYRIHKKEQTLRWTLTILAFLVVPLCIGKVNTSLLHSRYHATSVSTRAMLALPIQQVSRYVASYGEEMEAEDLAAIRKVLTWDVAEYQEKYNPYNFDGIKRGFNFNATKEDLAGFLKTWLKLFFKHPETYINATLNQNYCLFSPLKDNDKYYGQVRKGLNKIKNMDFSAVYELQEKTADMNQKLTDYYYLFPKLPLIGLYVNQGIMTLMLLGICLYALFDRNPKLLLLFRFCSHWL